MKRKLAIVVLLVVLVVLTLPTLAVLLVRGTGSPEARRPHGADGIRPLGQDGQDGQDWSNGSDIDERQPWSNRGHGPHGPRRADRADRPRRPDRWSERRGLEAPHEPDGDDLEDREDREGREGLKARHGQIADVPYDKGPTWDREDRDEFERPKRHCARPQAPCALQAASRPKTRLVRPVGPYQQVGILTHSANDGAGPMAPIPLYGRPTHRGSDRWNYYAVSNQHVPQKLPVFTKERDCARMMGCPEASDGDTLDVRGYGKATVTMYTLDDADRYMV